MDTQNDSTTLPEKGSAWPNETQGAQRMCRASGFLAVCTRAKGHDGPHVAQGTRDQVIDAWHRKAVA